MGGGEASDEEGSIGEGGKGLLWLRLLGDSGWDADLSWLLHECDMPPEVTLTGISRWLRSITAA